MTDKELLELAAKAAGIKLIGFAGPGCWSDSETAWGYQTKAFDRWNPLTDDGDALRLVVKLEIAVRYFDGEANAFGRDLEDHYEYGNDPYAATRRAIVRAAAEIGKDMK